MMDEKRVARRFSGRIGIYSRDQSGLNFGFITDLSRNGAYIETQRLVPRGTSYEFILSNGQFSTSVVSEVVRSRDAFFEGGTSGLAVRFATLSGLEKRVRDDLLLYLMNQKYQSIWDTPASIF